MVLNFSDWSLKQPGPSSCQVSMRHRPVSADGNSSFLQTESGSLAHVHNHWFFFSLIRACDIPTTTKTLFLCNDAVPSGFRLACARQLVFSGSTRRRSDLGQEGRIWDLISLAGARSSPLLLTQFFRDFLLSCGPKNVCPRLTQVSNGDFNCICCEYRPSILRIFARMRIQSPVRFPQKLFCLLTPSAAIACSRLGFFMCTCAFSTGQCMPCRDRSKSVYVCAFFQLERVIGSSRTVKKAIGKSLSVTCAEPRTQHTQRLRSWHRHSVKFVPPLPQRA